MNKIKNHFDKEAQEFDQIMLMLSPHYALMIEALATIALAKAGEAPQVLDIGCGSGNVSGHIKAKCPQAKITCIDISDNMLTLAQNRLKDYDDIVYFNSSAEEYAFDGHYDVIISSLALHHVKSDEVKQDIYTRIYKALNSGGVFFNADAVKSVDDDWQAMYTDKWKEYMLKSVSLEEIENKWIPRHEEYDSPKDLTNEMAMLKAAGFNTTEVVWKYFNTAIYGGLK